MDQQIATHIYNVALKRKDVWLLFQKFAENVVRRKKEELKKSASFIEEEEEEGEEEGEDEEEEVT